MNKKHDIPTKFQNQSPGSPFKVPDGYFDTLEDRIEARVASETKSISPKGKVIRMIKPLLAMAASFAIIFMLVYYPLSIFLPDYLARNTEMPAEKSEAVPDEEEVLLSYILMSEQSLYEILDNETEQTATEVTADEMLDYLATAMNETEIYAELKN
jgi:hypothetical protein